MKSAYWAFRRTAAQYRAAVLHESDANPWKVPATLGNLFASHILYNVGPRYFSLFGLSHTPRGDWSSFAVDTPAFKQLRVAMSPPEVRSITLNKARFYGHCVARGLPTISIHCLVGNESCARGYPGIRCVASPDDWYAAMADAPAELFVKRVDGSFGQGAFRVSRDGDVFHFAGCHGSLGDVYSYLRDKPGRARDWLVQPQVRCHPQIARIMSSSALGTVRAVTCIDDGGARLLFAIMKITVGGNVTDNFHHGSTGNLVTAIDIRSGALSVARGSTQREWPVISDMTHHPDTGYPIEGFVLPFWGEVVELALKAQESLPLLKSAGWDIAITGNGPLLVEANTAYSLDILQVAYRRGLKQELMRELGVEKAW